MRLAQGEPDSGPLRELRPELGRADDGRLLGSRGRRREHDLLHLDPALLQLRVALEEHRLALQVDSGGDRRAVRAARDAGQLDDRRDDDRDGVAHHGVLAGLVEGVDGRRVGRGVGALRGRLHAGDVPRLRAAAVGRLDRDLLVRLLSRERPGQRHRASVFDVLGARSERQRDRCGRGGRRRKGGPREEGDYERLHATDDVRRGRKLRRAITRSVRALVTGGTGRIGSAIVARLQGEGWTVVAAGRADGDLAAVEQARALVERAVEELGGLDLLVNAAGEGFAPRAVTEVTEADWDAAFGATVKGSFFVTQTAAAHLRASHGCIVMIEDVAAYQPWPSFAAHCAAKAAQAMLTRVLARALAPEVRVCGVAPGPVAVEPD
ncbi:MAG: SDR family NAD(P)-dependent oxidoreductase [Actinobacteria bacterium]|nr:MAG: SDR family NAD(P)-dependent oxidoreductase [Actinomycetota bacterium]